MMWLIQSPASPHARVRDTGQIKVLGRRGKRVVELVHALPVRFGGRLGRQLAASPSLRFVVRALRGRAAVHHRRRRGGSGGGGGRRRRRRSGSSSGGGGSGRVVGRRRRVVRGGRCGARVDLADAPLGARDERRARTRARARARRRSSHGTRQSSGSFGLQLQPAALHVAVRARHLQRDEDVPPQKPESGRLN